MKRFCSRKCKKRYQDRIRTKWRRARTVEAAVEIVDPMMVFERDKWTCQICDRPTPRHLLGTLQWEAPEMDHIVPLSRGGEHSYANTRCACKYCNSEKGDRLDSEVTIEPVGVLWAKIQAGLLPELIKQHMDSNGSSDVPPLDAGIVSAEKSFMHP